MDQLEFDVIGRIKELCAARNWTSYRLAKESNIQYAALSTMLRRTNSPSVPSLVKICDGLGITLAQFFSEEDETAKLTTGQKACLELWDQLSGRNQELAAVYMKGLADGQGPDKE